VKEADVRASLQDLSEARPISGRRRTKAEINVIKDAMVTLVTADHPMTVRQVFYRLVILWGGR
jgi:hypothetical protein